MASDGTAAASASRKDDHVRLAAAQRREPATRNDFDDVELVHHALDGIDASEVDLRTRVAHWTWRSPLYLNGMTGGTPKTTAVNRELAVAARETGMPMGSGSIGIALDDPDAAAGFRVIREENPAGLVFANIGVGRSADEARRAVDLLEADALQVHLNAVQETIMPEGSRAFSGWAASLEAIVAASEVPVIVKEVGFGLSRRTLERLRDMGVRLADVSGSGGTDFARIENARRSASDYAFLIGHGSSAVRSLLDAPEDGPTPLGSGGVRTPLDAVRALALGARAVGVAGAFLAPAVSGGAAEVVAVVRTWTSQLRDLHALFGAPTPEALLTKDVLVHGGVREFCELRGIDARALARRSEDQHPRAGGQPAGPDDRRTT
ncbi:type 2 isopentenyl-diphosphate Delta-isomerase [Microbacterium betulae]|uniref:Isopentenyl-diphosphate delta-isomerase n=1 Tax=Microbacterium betulae TaxID=2981139 RepID=A0AA97FI80_9MICO|nr:type 2 isopentenyl-diphosphate Delta-isomerase [Microbacterium sp. AB]WOF23708.1 type 2 isopentenyl-diphosphate Delta-isomerase [Microbacterium sp. AB]